ncbi:MAG TPA: hypothetical protein VHK47_21085 [Polyangia bacterium]|nr:hypothetical protein [Polyangia bacterium]
MPRTTWSNRFVNVSANRDRRSGRLSCSLSSATTPLTSFLSETVRAFAQMVSPRERFAAQP